MPNERLLKTYAHFFLKTQFQTLNEHTNGSSIPHVSKSLFDNTRIPLPPLPTQRRIVSILEKAEETKKLRAQADELTDRLLQSVFLEMFGGPVRNPKGWEIKTLGDVCISIKDGPHVSPNYVEDGVPFISVHNIINGFFDMSDLRYISYEDHKEFCRRCKPEKGDVLYSKGGTTGFAKRVDVDFEFSIWVHLALLKFSKEIINPIFLETCLNSNYCKVQAKINTRGIANKDLVLGRMAGIKIILPPLPLQQKFARIVEKIESMRQSQNQSKQQIEDLFSALMQKAFRGEI
ncbi:MAG: restriction endonuclease subunit S [Euryarchaeota archaeon]|nr:restriction endonuclease subunit S [Euryarchaeota archaeon]